MSLQELPRTAANGALKLVRLPVEIASGARELIADRLGGNGNGHDQAPTDVKPASRPKPPTPKAKTAVKAKPAGRAKTAPKPTAKPKPRRAAPKAKAARPARTPSSKTPAAEEPAVVTEQTEGLEDATDRAIEQRRGLG